MKDWWNRHEYPDTPTQRLLKSSFARALGHIGWVLGVILLSTGLVVAVVFLYGILTGSIA